MAYAFSTMVAPSLDVNDILAGQCGAGITMTYSDLQPGLKGVNLSDGSGGGQDLLSAAPICWQTCRKMAVSRSAIFSWALRISDSYSFSSGVKNLSASANVCLRI